VAKHTGTLIELGPGRAMEVTKEGRLKRAYMIREYICVGEDRIEGVKLTHYQDKTLQDAVGEEVTLVCTAGRAAFSIRTPARRVKPGFLLLFFKVARQVILLVVGGIVLAVIFLGVGSLIVNLLANHGMIDHVPDTPESMTMRQTLTTLAHYWPLDVVGIGTLATFLFFCVILPMHTIVDTARCWFTPL
jgi:hypothetical protein